MQGLVLQCRDLALPISLVVLLVIQSKDFLIRTSRAVSRVLVLQLQDHILPTEAFFALILEEFLGNFFVL